MIHIRFTILGYELGAIHVELPTAAETLDEFDDAVDAEIGEHVSGALAAVKRWLF